ncbi:hypothetical protein B0H63DRAFT_551926 [Podospora didyma]|uniref:Apple domain-containing protein n=1 Tax=Podospora didyma TaxID=330526 RepID=A0AAE0N4L4_9PEZI|nr:hypothetical protein B0H63DRAFT_551926 [Podospora didyma]
METPADDILSLASPVSAAAVQTTTVTTTVTAPLASTSSSGLFTAPTDVSLALNCAEIDKSRQQISYRGNVFFFNVNCGLNYIGPDIDIIGTVAYSFNNCMGACASYSYWSGNSQGCRGVSYVGNLALALAEGSESNCYLKKFINQTVENKSPLSAVGKLEI